MSIPFTFGHSWSDLESGLSPPHPAGYVRLRFTHSVIRARLCALPPDRLYLQSFLAYFIGISIPKFLHLESQLGIGRFTCVGRCGGLDRVSVAPTCANQPRRLIFSSCMLRSRLWSIAVCSAALAYPLKLLITGIRYRRHLFFPVTGSSIWAGPDTCEFRKPTPFSVACDGANKQKKEERI